jgi:NADPH:quinone reductase-like Zn-dependent oxidoreductase/malonyl CoA-acyl carrier protein transacylase
LSQPACTAIQLALVDLLRSWGIRPAAVAGHSSGEIAASYAADILTLEQCVKVAWARGQAAQTLKTEPANGLGNMMVVGASPAQLGSFLEAMKGRVVVACVNSDSNVTVSGDAEAIDQLEIVLGLQKMFVRKLQTGVAYHSHHTKGVADKYTELLGEVIPMPSTVPFHSTVRGRLISASEVTAAYWVENFVSPVQFSAAFRSLIGQTRSIYSNSNILLVELGPDAVLRSPIKTNVRDHFSDASIQYIHSLKRDADAVESVHTLASALFAAGIGIDFGAVNVFDSYKKDPALIKNLPSYPWDHSIRHWHQSRIAQNSNHPEFARNDILGSFSVDNVDLEPRWRNILRTDDFPWIRQHKVHGNSVYPMSGFIAMAIEGISQLAVREKIELAAVELRDIKMQRMLLVPDTHDIEVMVSMKPSTRSSMANGSWYEFRVFSWADGRGWDEHCQGFVIARGSTAPNPVNGEVSQHDFDLHVSQTLSSIAKGCKVAVDATQMYDNIASSSVSYGPLFRGLSNITFCEDGKAVANGQIPDLKRCMPSEYETEYHLHPVTLDIVLQIFWILSGYDKPGPHPAFLASSVKHITIPMQKPLEVGTMFKVSTIQDRDPLQGDAVSYRIWGSQENSEQAWITIDGFTLAQVNSSAGGLDATEQRSLCFKERLEPCLDLLSESGHTLCSYSHNPVKEGKAAVCLDKMANQNPKMNILQIGSGTQEETVALLECLGGKDGNSLPRFRHYTYSDVFAECSEKVAERLKHWKLLVSYKSLDVSEDPISQGFAAQAYDLVIAIHTVNSTNRPAEYIAIAQSLLKPGGKLLILDGSASSETAWASALTTDRFSGIDLSMKDASTGLNLCLDDISNCVGLSRSVIVATAVDYGGAIKHDIVVVGNAPKAPFSTDELLDEFDTMSGKSTSTAQLTALEASGKICIVTEEVGQSLLSRPTEQMFLAVQHLFANAKGVLWVIGHHGESAEEAEKQMIIGMARTVRTETGLTLATLDLGDLSTISSKDALHHISGVFNTVFGASSVLSEGDLEFVVRSGEVCVPRLVEDHSMNYNLLQEAGKAPPGPQKLQQGGRPLTMKSSESNTLDGLFFTDDDTVVSSVNSDHVEIQVCYTGLNFKDIMIATGRVPKARLGVECSGIVKAVGAQVQGFTVGDRVCAITIGSFSTTLRCPATHVWKLQDTTSFEVAASIPVTFCTAYYSLMDLGRLEKGDKVLIHSAAGGVGQAAIIIAQAVGAEIFATVSTSDKKQFLKKAYGLNDEQILFSRDTNFAKDILQATNGYGVDVVLNSLSGDALRVSFGCLATFGRFVELGKQDILQNSRLEMAHFNKNVSIASVDLVIVMMHKPRLLQRLLRDVFTQFSEVFAKPPWPITEFPVSEAEEAFRSLSSGRTIGKIVVQMDDANALVKVLYSPTLFYNY